MKNWFLQFKINNLKKSRENRGNISFEKAKNFGFIFNSVDEFKKNAAVLKDLESLSKNVFVIVQYKNKKDEKPNFRFFNMNQVGVFGKIISEDLLNFNKEKLDFLFYFGKSKNQLIEYTLLKNNAKCRVGYFKEGNEYLFDLMFDKFKSENEILEKIKQIRVNE